MGGSGAIDENSIVTDVDWEWFSSPDRAATSGRRLQDPYDLRAAEGLGWSLPRRVEKYKSLLIVLPKEGGGIAKARDLRFRRIKPDRPPGRGDHSGFGRAAR